MANIPLNNYYTKYEVKVQALDRVGEEPESELIDEQCKSVLEENDVGYSLKAELFNFSPRLSLNNKGSDNFKKQVDKNKRLLGKRKPDCANKGLREFNQRLLPFLQHIKAEIFPNHQEMENMPRYWDMGYEFPQFHGVNGTKRFQSFSFHNREFIIPPLSRFFNHDIRNLSSLLKDLDKYDLIVMDMPWRNKYIRRLKKVKQSLSYDMLRNEELKSMPIEQLTHSKTLVALWCTNSHQHQRMLIEDFLPKWNLKLVHSLKWFKLNTEGNLIGPLKGQGFKQPYETLYIACHKNNDLESVENLREISFIFSIPSIIHSHKPPLYTWLKEYWPGVKDLKCLEIFARYLHPHFTSIGLEVIKHRENAAYAFKRKLEVQKFSVSAEDCPKSKL
ncbi:hypothetical protein GQX74_013889 [Glossina fuscipes]|nr:hypothetical protein GQX74_013889 [Glossina fuscipes]